MYRDSQLGLCLDLTGPDGNVFGLWAIGDDLARQLGCKQEWKDAVKAAQLMGASYITFVQLFEQFFPVVTLIGKEEIFDAHETALDVVAED